MKITLESCTSQDSSVDGSPPQIRSGTSVPEFAEGLLFPGIRPRGPDVRVPYGSVWSKSLDNRISDATLFTSSSRRKPGCRLLSSRFDFSPSSSQWQTLRRNEGRRKVSGSLMLGPEPQIQERHRFGLCALRNRFYRSGLRHTSERLLRWFSLSYPRM